MNYNTNKCLKILTDVVKMKSVLFLNSFCIIENDIFAPIKNTVLSNYVRIQHWNRILFFYIDMNIFIKQADII